MNTIAHVAHNRLQTILAMIMYQHIVYTWNIKGVIQDMECKKEVESYSLDVVNI